MFNNQTLVSKQAKPKSLREQLVRFHVDMHYGSTKLAPEAECSRRVEGGVCTITSLHAIR
jgi:hypothetical protein